MKLKVEKRFRDKITGELHQVGDTFEVEDARGEELLNHEMGIVSEVKARGRKADKKKSPKE